MSRNSAAEAARAREVLEEIRRERPAAGGRELVRLLAARGVVRSVQWVYANWTGPSSLAPKRRDEAAIREDLRLQLEEIYRRWYRWCRP